MTLTSDNFISSLVAVLLVAILSLLLKTFGFKGAPVFVALAFCFLISSFSDELNEIVSLISDVSSYADIAPYSEACIKVIGIGYLSWISGDVCRELGENGAAKCVGILGKLELMGVCIPFIRELASVAFELIGV